MAFGDVLRGLGSVLNPAVAQEAAQEDAQQRGLAGQVGLMKLKQEIDQQSPEYQARLEALKNDKLFREEAASSGGDIGKIASAAVKYGKPDLAVNLLNQQEQRAQRAQVAADALETRRLQLQQSHELALQRLTDQKDKDAATQDFRKAQLELQRQSHAARQEALTQGNQIKLLQLELQGNKADADKIRKTDTETMKLQAALEKSNLPEADAVLGTVEKALEISPKVAEYLSGPKSLLPDVMVPDDVKFARQAFQKLFNITLKNRSGAAVTNQEMDRLKKEFATGVIKTPQQLSEAVNQARNIINKHYAAVASGFSSDAMSTYNERIRQFGGRVVLEPKSGGEWKVEEVK
jgi:hypothetical protein